MYLCHIPLIRSVNIYLLNKTVDCFSWLTRVVLVFATERKNNVDPCLRSQTNVDYYVNVYHNKVMCHLSMMLSDKFDPNQM